MFVFFKTNISACLVGINPGLVGGQLTLLNSLEPVEVREESKFPCYDIGRGPHSWHSYFSGYNLTRALPSGLQDL